MKPLSSESACKEERKREREESKKKRKKNKEKNDSKRSWLVDKQDHRLCRYAL